MIPAGWDSAHLGDKATKVGSGITPTGGERVYKREGRPFLRSQNVDWGTLLLDDIAFIDEDTHAKFQDTEIESDDVFLNITGASIGRSAVADARVKGGNVNQHVCIIRTNQEQLHPRFLNYFLLSQAGQRQIESFQAGGNRQGLNFGQIRSFRLPLPPLPEQRAIAGALSDVDDLIGALDELIAKKRDLKQAAMQQLFAGKQRLPGFTDKWELKRLGDIADGIVGGGTPSRSNSNFWGGNIPWVTVKDFATFNPRFTQESITDEGLNKSASHLIPKGTVITSTRMALGKAVIYGVDVSINQDLKAIFPTKDMDSQFLYYWFENNEKYIEGLGGGSTVKGISLSDLRAIEFLKPSLREQVAIRTVLSNMDADIETLEQRRDKTRSIKQGMMQELLTGKTRLI